jgi:hypothetical protein
MNITRVTLQWYRQKLEPKWASALAEKELKVSIDGVINSQAETPQQRRKRVDPEFVIHNLLNLAKYYRKSGRLREELKRISESSGTGPNSKKHRAVALKWYRRLTE